MIRGHRDGFTLLELMVVVLVVGILARLALPAYQGLVLKARAAEALGDINAIRVAAYAYNADTNRWPPDVNRGVVPPELVPYLGDGFTFDREHYRLDWDNWMLPDGSPRYPDLGVLVGVSITTTNEALGNALIGLLGENTVQYTINEHYTFFVLAAS
jgi:prepilin-type N-terminal cleavage/methylation domain-containing protein